jgi:hypothetical protein
MRKPTLMHWRYIVSFLIGGFLGFAGQFAVDVVQGHAWEFSEREDMVNSTFETSDGKVIGTPSSSTIKGQEKHISADEAKPKIPGLSKAQQNQLNLLWDQLLFLAWLTQNGQKAALAATCTAIVSTLAVFTLGRGRRNRSKHEHDDIL